jgi:hypothetical protein
MKLHEPFALCGLHRAGPVPCGTPVPEEARGVYVVATVSESGAAHPTVPMSHLPASLKARWLQEPVEFHQHHHGRKL